MTEETETQTISRALVPERDRTDLVDALFGLNFPLQLEPCVFAVASELSSDYHGGYWAFQSLGNGGFYMAPDDDARFTVRSENGFEGTMTADAFGVTVCLYAYSRLSFIATKPASTTYARHYHLLREYAMDHPEVAEIVRATD